MAISRSSALKINTKARITHLQRLRRTSPPLFEPFTSLLCVLRCVFGWLEESLAFKLRMGGPHLIIRLSNVTAQRVNNRVNKLQCCCWAGRERFKIPSQVIGIAMFSP